LWICRFCGHFRQTLDFSGLQGLGGKTINKVIHTIPESTAKRFEIKDLSALCENGLKNPT
jgi:hypothetical protein